MVATDGSGRLGYEHEKHIVHARVVNDLNVGEIEGVFLTLLPAELWCGGRHMFLVEPFYGVPY